MNTPLPPIPREDRDHLVRHGAGLWRELAGARFFITGGTGFYGKWLLESIAAANDELGANARAMILSRDPGRFASETPHLAARPEFSWLRGDAADFALPPGGFDYVFHFATSSAAEVGAGDTPILMQNLRGTERILQFARACGAKRLLYASSGAIYGRQPADIAQMAEDYAGGPQPTNPATAYGEMKRLSESMCIGSGIDCVIARGFAFVGPYLPLTDKFAIGSFMRDALAGGSITIRGDGSPLRSYLHAADLVLWLLTILARGRRGRAYNVGADRPMSLLALAELVASRAPGNCAVAVRGSRTEVVDRYIPDTSRAADELGLRTTIGLEQAIERSMTALAAARRQPAARGVSACAG